MSCLALASWPFKEGTKLGGKAGSFGAFLEAAPTPSLESVKVRVSTSDVSLHPIDVELPIVDIEALELDICRLIAARRWCCWIASLKIREKLVLRLLGVVLRLV